jgi:hypothetical protein
MTDEEISVGICETAARWVDITPEQARVILAWEGLHAFHHTGLADAVLAVLRRRRLWAKYADFLWSCERH